MIERNSDWYARAEKGISCSLVRDWPNVSVERAEGSYAYGPEGQVYLDFCSGMGANNIGHCHPKVVRAIQSQAEKLIHGPMGVLLYESIVELAEQLGAATPEGLDAFFFLNSGSEAVEASIKLARYVTGRPGIVSFRGGFHGRTMGALSVTTSKAMYRNRYEPLVPSVYRLPYPSLGDGVDHEAHLQTLLRHEVNASDIAAFIIEPILGEGGYVEADPAYLTRLREFCTEHGIMLIFDEVQTGFGRTGHMFAAQGLGVTPDIMAIAKGIASGLPLGAAVASRELMSRWTAGAHGTTFGGNPVACAAALATLEVFEEEDVLANVQRQGQRAKDYLVSLQQEHRCIGEVRGRGLMLGVEFVDPRDGHSPNPEAVQAVLQGCLDKGVILYPAGPFGQVIRFIPPLNVTTEELDAGLKAFGEAVAAIST